MDKQQPQQSRQSAPLAYTTGTLLLADFPVFFICLSHFPVRIDFCRKEHEQAQHWLQKHAQGRVALLPREERRFPRLLEELLAGRCRTKQLPDSPFVSKATSWQKRVWSLLLEIPYGETRTYGEVAQALGNIGLARAVGRACGANPLPLVIPCHRVVAATGPGGFTGGLNIKRCLLAREQGAGPCR